MDKWASNINKLCTAVTPYTYILIAVAFIVIGCRRKRHIESAHEEQ